MPCSRSILVFARSILLLTSLPAAVFPQLTPSQRTAALESFEIVWRTVRDRHPDPKLNGLDWQAIHDSTRPRIARARSLDEVRDTLREMLAKLQASHYALIPADLYNGGAEPHETSAGKASPGIVPDVVDGKALVGSVEPGSPAARAGVRPGMVLEAIGGATISSLAEAAGQGKDAETQKDAQRLLPRSLSRKLEGPAGEPVRLDVVDANGVARRFEINRVEPEGKLVSFGNLPEQRLVFESRALPSGAGYIRFNEFLDPVSLMPRFEEAVSAFAKTPGIVLDLRGNPGGIGLMAMGIAGFFIDREGQKLGEMKMRETTLKFVVFPRPQAYRGRLALLVDAGSASTSEILAQGLRDLDRARIFGVRTAGAALPSDIVRLPDGDGFQYPQASYTSAKGIVVEGRGVTPDTEVRQTREALQAGRDPMIEAAEAWIVR